MYIKLSDYLLFLIKADASILYEQHLRELNERGNTACQVKQYNFSYYWIHNYQHNLFYWNRARRNIKTENVF